MIFWVLVIAYFVQNGVSDLAFHWRGEESPRDARRASRQKAVTDWASGRKAGRKSHPPVTPKRGKPGPWREYFRDLNADCAAGATERRRALRDNRKARRDRRKTRKAEAKRNPTPVRKPTPRSDASLPVLEFERNTGNDGLIDDRGRVLPDNWCHRHLGDEYGPLGEEFGFCGRETDGGLYCDDCAAELAPVPANHEPPTEQELAPPEPFRDEDGVPVCRYCGDNLDRCPAGGAATSHCCSDEAAAEAAAYVAAHPAAQCPECGRWVNDERDADGAAHYSHTHYPRAGGERSVTEWTVPPPPPEDDRPQPVADQPAQPEQPQTSAAEPKGTTMPDISAAEGGLEAHIAYDEAVIATLNELVSSLEHTAADRESSDQGGDAVTGLNEAAEEVGTARAAVERSLECLLAALVVREANEAADWTAGDKEFLRA